jgi:hypothetical protein
VRLEQRGERRVWFGESVVQDSQEYEHLPLSFIMISIVVLRSFEVTNEYPTFICSVVEFLRLLCMIPSTLLLS